MTETTKLYGIDNLKKVIDLGIELEKVGVHVAQNGKDWAKDMKDLFDHVPSLFFQVQALVAGGSQIPLELKDLDSSEAAELFAYVSEKLTVDGEKAQRIVGASIKLVGDMVVDGMNLFKAIQA